MAVLSVLKWILASVSTTDRWYPVFSRYVGQVGERVGALGGDPDAVVASPGGTPGTARFDCHTLRWLLPLVLAPLVVLVALTPLAWAGPLAAAGVVLVLAVACYWFWRCRPSPCEVLFAFVLGFSVAGLVLGVVALLGLGPAQLGYVLAVLAVAVGVLVIVAALRGCCCFPCADEMPAPAWPRGGIAEVPRR